MKKGIDPKTLKEFKRFAANIAELNKQAITAYRPLIEDLCQREGTEKEVEVCLDALLNYVGDTDAQKMFHRICQQYLPIYPDCIAFYMKTYREMQGDEHEEH